MLNFTDVTWSGTSDLSVAVLSNGEKVAVKFGSEEIGVQMVFQRLNRGERGDDLPVVMQAFGVDYEAACDAVFNGRFEDAAKLLRSAAGKPPAKATEFSPKLIEEIMDDDSVH